MPYLLNEINASLQIHTKVNELPLNAFLFVFFLLQYEHVVVKELLESFIGIVDTQLLKAVELKTNGALLLTLSYRLVFCIKISLEILLTSTLLVMLESLK